MNFIRVADVKDFLKETTNKYHFILSDLPYEIGLVGKDWDKSGIAFDVELYRLMLDVMLPGGFAAFYGFSRTHHRVLCALEDAGWIVHKTLFAWIYPDGNAQGAQNTSRGMDKRFAAKYGGICKCDNPNVNTESLDGYLNSRFEDNALSVKICSNCGKVVQTVLQEIQHSKSGGMKKIGGPGYGNGNVQTITSPLCYESEIMSDYTHGLGWSKPVLDPIMIVQKPYGNIPEITNIIKYGTGLVNKSGKHPGNFFYIHLPDCTPEKCAAECVSHKLKYQYSGFHAEELGTEIIDATKARIEKHVGLAYENIHPSVKPISVNEYMGKLFLPPESFFPFTALVPFSGSGSEVIGLRKSGWKMVDAVEINEEYAQTHYDRYSHYFPDDEIVMVS